MKMSKKVERYPWERVSMIVWDRAYKRNFHLNILKDSFVAAELPEKYVCL